MSHLHLVFDVVKLTPAPPDPIPGHHPRPPPPLEIMDGEEEWIVEEILDSNQLEAEVSRQMGRFQNQAQLLGTLGQHPHPGPHCRILLETSWHSMSSQSHWLFYYPILCSAGSSLPRRGWMSRDTHFLQLLCYLFLLPLHYLLFHLPILFLNNVYNHLWASPSISEHCIDFPFTFCYSSFLYSFIHFSNISIGQTLSQTLPMTPMSIFILIYLYFYLYFYLHFSCYHVSPLYPGSWFSFHI